MSLDSLIYVSSASYEMTDAELAGLLDQSRRSNAAHGITGILLHWDGNFLQYIEGSPDTLNGLYVRLEADLRHRGLIVLERRAIAARAYPDWRMAFRRLVRTTRSDGESDFLLDDAASPEALAPTTRHLLEMFRQNLR